MSVRLRDIAEATELSAATVSRALRGDPTLKVAPDTLRRVLEAAARMGYRPNRTATFLQRGRTGVLAIMVSEYAATSWVSRQTFALTIKIQQGIYEAAAEQGYHTALIVPSPGQCARVFQQDLLGGQRVDGVVLFGEPVFADYIPGLLRANIPCVSFWKDAARHGVPHVHHEMRQAVRELAATARKQGHRRSGCVYHARVGYRLRLWAAFAAQQGISVPLTCRASVEDEADAYRATLRLLQRPNRPSLIYYTSDHYAVAGMKAAADLRLSIPRDISMVGSDDAPYVPAACGLATIRHPYREMGHLAARTLFTLIEGGRVPADTLQLHSEFVPRASLGTVPARHTGTPGKHMKGTAT